VRAPTEAANKELSGAPYSRRPRETTTGDASISSDGTSAKAMCSAQQGQANRPVPTDACQSEAEYALVRLNAWLGAPIY